MLVQLMSVAALFACVCVGSLSITLNETSLCGDWRPYKDEKCLKIIERAGQQTQEDAEVVCQSFAEEMHTVPRLLSIKTQEQQEFVRWFLFVENAMLDNVWLGLKRRGSLLEWSDGSGLTFSNWANETLSDEQHECVEMESGDGVLAAGLWLRVNCKRKNVVICERKPSWTLETLQNSFLDFKLQQGMEQKKLEEQIEQSQKKIVEWEAKFEQSQKKIVEWEAKFEQSQRKISELEQRSDASGDEIKQLKNNPVPLGFIYVQLASQQSPTILWSTTTWADVSSNYSGLFFRVVGGKAAAFGQIQEANTTRLEQVQKHFPTFVANLGTPTIPSDGNWSQYVHTGRNTGGDFLFLRFRLSTEEIRPRNQAVKIWQRIM